MAVRETVLHISVCGHSSVSFLKYDIQNFRDSYHKMFDHNKQFTQRLERILSHWNRRREIHYTFVNIIYYLNELFWFHQNCFDSPLDTSE